MYVGVCMSVCSYIVRMFTCCVCECKIQYFCLLDSYGTAHNKLATPTLHCFYSYKLNYTLRLLLQKDCTCQHSLLSVHDSNYNSRNLRNPDQTAQSNADRSVFLYNSGNICKIGLACVTIYSLRVSRSDSDTFLLLGIRTEKPMNN